MTGSPTTGFELAPPRPALTPATAAAPARVGPWRRFLAATRLSLSAVCDASTPLGGYDYHNHADAADGVPWHVEGGRRCARCGKRYRV